MFNHLKKPSELPVGADLHLFKEGCEPSWESCLSGGTWLMILEPHTHGIAELDKMWIHLVFVSS